MRRAAPGTSGAERKFGWKVALRGDWAYARCVTVVWTAPFEPDEHPYADENEQGIEHEERSGLAVSQLAWGAAESKRRLPGRLGLERGQRRTVSRRAGEQCAALHRDGDGLRWGERVVDTDRHAIFEGPNGPDEQDADEPGENPGHAQLRRSGGCAHTIDAIGKPTPPARSS